MALKQATMQNNITYFLLSEEKKCTIYIAAFSK